MTRRLARFVGVFLLLAGITAWAQRPQLLEPYQGPRTLVPDAAFQSEGTAVRFNAPQAMGLRYGEEIDLTLPSAARHTYVFELAPAHGGGVQSWIGYHKERGKSYRALVTTGPEGSFGVFSTPDGEFRLVPGKGHDWLVDMTAEQEHLPIINLRNDARIAPPGPKSAVNPVHLAEPFVAIPGVNTVGMTKAAPTPSYYVDLLIAYTNGYATRLGGSLMTRLNFLVERANLSYEDSDVAIRLRLVGTIGVNYPDIGDNGDALSAATPGCVGSAVISFCGNTAYDAATFGPVETARTAVAADLVAVLRDGGTTGGSGIAWVGSASPNANFMYSVTTGCVSSCEHVFIHEVGHNMGNHHDRATAAWQDGGGPSYPGSAGFAFGYAYCQGGTLTCDPLLTNGTLGSCSAQPECLAGSDPNNFADIMAYFHGSTLRNYRFSNPAVLDCAGSNGVQRACGTAQSNTALSMNNNRVALSGIKGVATPFNSAIQFTAGAFAATEAAGSIAFTVSRVGGSAGAVSVSWAMSNGSANAADYTATTGTLNWPDGDSTNKTINVAVANDGVPEGNETFTVTLSNVTGPAGVALGEPSSATGIILGAWPPGGTLPPGFATPAGSAGGSWTVASDHAYEGGQSLRSAQPISTALGEYVNSDLVFTGNLQAGTVAFAYRVSSWQNEGYFPYGVFEFSIDGTVVLSDGGETGWKFVAFAVTSGNHTLRWRYKNALTSPCSGGWNPPAPGGVNCADRAWIDALVLPLASVASTTSISALANPVVAGQPAVLTATVTGSAGTPTGSVTFMDGASPVTGCASLLLSAGAATCNTLALWPGAHTLSAVYSGSNTYLSSSSAPFAFTVTTGTQLLSASPATLAFGAQSMNTTAPAQTVTYTNTSGSTVTLGSTSLSAGVGLAGTTCTHTLAGGASGQASYTFTPQFEGSLSGIAALAYPGGGPTVVTMTGVGERSLVTHYYRSILRRDPDAGGKTFWEGESGRVAALGANLNETWFAMAQTFFFSPEYTALGRDNPGFVTDLYNTFFNRAPDGAGLAFWQGQLDSGMPREVLLTSFMFSAEFAGFTELIFGSTSARPEVDTVIDFYRGLLSRLPDDSGFNFWVQRFRTAQCQGTAAVQAQVEAISSAFANSAEYAARSRSNAQYIGDLYNAFLRRGGDLGGVQFWVGQLSTRSRDALRREFLASAEFNARVNAIIAAGCLP